jgi:hypothetical protein
LVDPDNVASIASALTGMLNATYPHPVIYNPQLLRRRVINAFGFDAFKAALSSLVESRLAFDLCGNGSSPGLTALDDER